MEIMSPFQKPIQGIQILAANTFNVFTNVEKLKVKPLKTFNKMLDSQ